MLVLTCIIILMLPTWYPISTLHILTSPVHFLCPDHAIVLVSYLCTLSNRDFFINFLVYLVHFLIGVYLP